MAFNFCIDVPDVPRLAETTRDDALLIHVQFHGNGKKDYNVEYEKLKSTMLTEYLRQRDGPDFHENLMKLTFNITPVEVANNFCRSVLERGIFCRQRPYIYLGHSDEQLAKKSCYFIAATHEEIHDLLSKFGDFSGEKNVAKRASKIAMLFSPLIKTVHLDENYFKVEPDVTDGVFPSHTFTDGCGFMSLRFASEVQQVLDLDYQPSAVHVRYRGIEGMLILKEDLSGIKVQFHKSMQKFLDPDGEKPDVFNIVNVIGYSRPFTNGYLNSRMIMLLEERGVSAQSLEALQDDYHELLEGINKGTSDSEYFLMLKGEIYLLQVIQDNGIDGRTKRELKRLQKRELEEMEKATYTRVLVPKSREVFAVCDPLNKLNYGECYFNPTIDGDKARDFTAGQKFVVMRSQCYHPGDVRVLKMTDKRKGYEKLKDCLVLPVKGPRPHAFECFGGDLSGKKFFVSWDENILPSGKEKPCNYSPSVKAKISAAAAHSVSKLTSQLKRTNPSKGVEDRKEMELYFATYSDQISKEIEQAYLQCATTSSLSSKEFRHLSKMLYQVTIPGEDLQDLQEELNSIKSKIPSGKSTGLPIDHEPQHAYENPETEHELSTISGPSRRQVSLTGSRSTSLAASLDSSLDEEDFEERQSLRHNTTSATTACEGSAGDSCHRGIKIWQKIDDKAKEFVHRMQREMRKIVV